MSVISSQQLGDRIAAARKRARSTQAHVAERLGLARTTLVAIEKGERRPSSSELVELARVLGVSVHDLLRESLVAGEVSARFRAASGVQKQPEVLSAVERLRVLAARYVELERMHELRRPRAPLETLQTYRLDQGGPHRDARLEGEDAARTVRSMLGLGDEPAMDLDERFETEAGLRIFYLDRLPSKVAAFLIWADELGACVAINRAHPPERRRWSIVHEVGHFLRDREAGDILEMDGPHRHAGEIFPEAFTKEFLLPAAGVQRRFAERCRAGRFTPVDLYALARSFGVSFQAMTLRLEELRLLPRGSYDKIVQSRLRSQDLGARGGVVGLQVPTETLGLPERYIALAIRAYDQDLLSEGEFADFLNTDVVTARAVVQQRSQTVDDGHQMSVDFSAADLRTA